MNIRPETGVQVHRLQLVHIYSVIHGFVTVPAHQHLVALPCASQDGTQDPRRTSIHEKSCLAGPVDPGGLLLGFLQYPVRVVEIVKSLDLRDVDPVGKAAAETLRISLVPRHVEPVIVRIAVLVQSVVKFCHLVSSYIL